MRPQCDQVTPIITLQRLKQWFIEIGQNKFECTLCNQILETNKNETEKFWVHQQDEKHLKIMLDQLLPKQKQEQQKLEISQIKEFKLFDLNEATILQKNEKLLGKYFIKCFKQELMKKIQLKGSLSKKILFIVIIRLYSFLFMNKENQLNEQNLYTYLQTHRQSKDIQVLRKLSKSLNIPIENVLQKLPIEKEQNFSYLASQYFRELIIKLLSKNQYLEALMYNLGRMGISIKQMSSITFEDIDKKAKKYCLKGYYVLSSFQLIFGELEKKRKEKNKGYLFPQPINTKECRRVIDKAKVQLQNDEETLFQSFLDLLCTRSLNKLYKQDKQQIVKSNKTKRIEQQCKNQEQNEEQEISLQLILSLNSSQYLNEKSNSCEINIDNSQYIENSISNQIQNQFKKNILKQQKTQFKKQYQQQNQNDIEPIIRKETNIDTNQGSYKTEYKMNYQQQLQEILDYVKSDKNEKLMQFTNRVI